MVSYKMTLSAIVIITPFFGASELYAGDPLFNLPWFLQDAVVATTITEEEHRTWRTSGTFEVEMELRQQADADAVWVEPLPTKSELSQTSCEDFRLSRYSDWVRRNTEETSSVPQWREAWHGVAVRVRADRQLLSLSRVRRIELVAAVRNPGVPEAALDPSREGAIQEKFFEVASVYRAAGFDRMVKIVQPMKMTLTNQKTCDGFVIYHWVLEN